jgi:dihydroorotase
LAGGPNKEPEVHDLIIRGGRVIDKTQGLDAILDVAIDGHRITAVGTNLEADGVRQVVDATGLIVTPGLVDLHTHGFWGVPPLGIEPDPHFLRRGVTTAVDAGSAGASTFPAFRRYIIDVSATRIVALLNISQIGMARDRGDPDQVVGELEDLRWARVDRAIEIARAHADVIVGIKVRLSAGIVGPGADDCVEALRRSREAAEAIGKPVMAHIGGTPAPLDQLLPMMSAGDIVTHVFHGGQEGVLDERGRVRTSVLHAVDRGVGFDVGHGAGSFSFGVARRGLEQGLIPATISSDLHAYNVDGPVYDLVTTASKFLHLGMPLEDVLPRITAAPARAIGMLDRVGTLAPGAEADVTLLRMAEGEFQLSDARRQVETASRRLEAVSVVRAGQVWPCTVAPAAPPHTH